MWRQCVVLFPQEGFSHSQRDRGRERFHLEAVGDDEKMDTQKSMSGPWAKRGWQDFSLQCLTEPFGHTIDTETYR